MENPTEQSPVKPEGVPKNMYLAVALVIIILLISYCYWYKPNSTTVSTVERLDQPASHSVFTDNAMMYYTVPDYISTSTTTNVAAPTRHISPTGTRGTLGYTVPSDWFSGVRAKKSVILGRVNNTCKLYSLDIVGTVKDQGWGNYCGRIGMEVTRNGSVVLRKDAQTNIPELRRGWLNLRYAATILDSSQTQNFTLQAGDVISVFIQGLWPGCSASAKHSTFFSLGISDANSESITPEPAAGYSFY